MARHGGEDRLEHRRWIGGVAGRGCAADQIMGQPGTEQQFHAANQRPAGAAREHRRPPFAFADFFRAGKEAEIIRLFADLGQEREERGEGEAEIEQADAAIGRAKLTREARPFRQRGRAGPEDIGDRRDLQHDPDALGRDLEPGDGAHAVEGNGDDHQCADQIGDAHRHTRHGGQRHGHDRGFDREKQEGEAGVDERGEGRAEIAEPCATGEQVDVEAVLGGVIGDRQADDEHQRDGGGDGGDAVGEAVGQGDGRADRFAGEEGGRADGGIGDLPRRPAPGAVGGVAQGIILQCLAGDPLIVEPLFAQDIGGAVHQRAAVSAE